MPKPKPLIYGPDDPITREDFLRVVQAAARAWKRITADVRSVSLAHGSLDDGPATAASMMQAVATVVKVADEYRVELFPFPPTGHREKSGPVLAAMLDAARDGDAGKTADVVPMIDRLLPVDQSQLRDDACQMAWTLYRELDEMPRSAAWAALCGEYRITHPRAWDYVALPPDLLKVDKQFAERFLGQSEEWERREAARRQREARAAALKQEQEQRLAESRRKRGEYESVRAELERVHAEYAERITAARDLYDEVKRLADGKAPFTDPAWMPAVRGLVTLAAEAGVALSLPAPDATNCRAVEVAANIVQAAADGRDLETALAGAAALSDRDVAAVRDWLWSKADATFRATRVAALEQSADRCHLPPNAGEYVQAMKTNGELPCTWLFAEDLLAARDRDASGGGDEPLVERMEAAEIREVQRRAEAVRRERPAEEIAAARPHDAPQTGPSFDEETGFFSYGSAPPYRLPNNAGNQRIVLRTLAENGFKPTRVRDQSMDGAKLTQAAWHLNRMFVERGFNCHIDGTWAAMMVEFKPGPKPKPDGGGSRGKRKPKSKVKRK